MTDHERQMEQCQHVWIYDHLEHEILYMKCPRCGQIRPTMPGESACRISRELNIRHDDKDGDV